MLSSLSEEVLQTLVGTVCRRAAADFGVPMQLALWKQSRDLPGEEAYRARVSYVGPLGQPGADSARITLDLTCFETVLLPVDPHPVIHPYSDAPTDPLCVRTYCLEEMFAEKLRALVRRPGMDVAWDRSIGHLTTETPTYAEVISALEVLLPDWLAP